MPIYCIACEHACSEQAIVCPACGHPIQDRETADRRIHGVTNRTRLIIAAANVLVVAVGAFVYFHSEYFRGGQSSKEPPASPMESGPALYRWSAADIMDRWAPSAGWVWSSIDPGSGEDGVTAWWIAENERFPGFVFGVVVTDRVKMLQFIVTLRGHTNVDVASKIRQGAFMAANLTDLEEEMIVREAGRLFQLSESQGDQTTKFASHLMSCTRRAIDPPGTTATFMLIPVAD